MLFVLTTANIVRIRRHKNNQYTYTHNEKICYDYSLNINTLILQTILLNSIIRKGYLRFIKPFQHYVIWRLFSIGTFCQSAIQQLFFFLDTDAHMILSLTLWIYVDIHYRRRQQNQTKTTKDVDLNHFIDHLSINCQYICE